MTKVVLWSSDKGDVPANLAFTNNFAATTNPSTANDITQGYTAGSEWINTATNECFKCTSSAAGAAVWELMTTGSGTPGQLIAPAASTPTGNGSAATVKGGAGGATSGNGGDATISGGDATAGNGNGGDLNLVGGAKNGSGVNGAVRVGSASETVFFNQGAPAAKTVSATLTAAELLSKIITVNQGAAGASALQLPLATDLDTALPTSVAGDAFDFSVINISTVAAEDATITTNTGWTLVGNIDIASNAAATDKSAGRFRARKTGAGAWTLYRLS